MALDRALLAEKLIKYRNQFQLTIGEVTYATGIDEKMLTAYENQEKVPTGDEILILSDYYKCDYKFFISNEKLAPFEQTETLFRRYGKEFSKEDRWSIQEFLFLAECESYLIQNLPNIPPKTFKFLKQSHIHKINGINASKELRKFLKYAPNQVPLNIYKDFRAIGVKAYRRKLFNSKISGLYIRHPLAGKCILINYSEDIYRQRFTASHEAAHAILDDDEEDVIVSFKGATNHIEVGANNFASHYLLPPEFLQQIPECHSWDTDKALLWANKLKVSTEALAYALKNSNLIDVGTEKLIKSVRVKRHLKSDPELSEDLSPNSRIRKKFLLERGLSTYYVNLCFEAYRANIITAPRMAEILLVEQNELFEIADLYGEVYSV